MIFISSEPTSLYMYSQISKSFKRCCYKKCIQNVRPLYIYIYTFQKFEKFNNTGSNASSDSLLALPKSVFIIL